ncbi:hypothetical protein GE061_001064 [Apolygus lucorum]|uniref:Uncharacterized protein n=1 Tax=Apolygus lucorum TaxID=248454 RepID=A0A8S9Y615_APOLU|nr:hypothetical protein GE061_001064 [Apolygus lucorum]
MQKAEATGSAQSGDGPDGKSGSRNPEEAATKIQAGVRGFLVRKRQKNEKEASSKHKHDYTPYIVILQKPRLLVMEAAELESVHECMISVGYYTGHRQTGSCRRSAEDQGNYRSLVLECIH